MESWYYPLYACKPIHFIHQITLRHPLEKFEKELSSHILKEKLVNQFKNYSRDEIIDFNNDSFSKFFISVPELLRRMLAIDPKKRISAREIMQDYWVKTSYSKYTERDYLKFIKKQDISFYTPFKQAYNAKKIKKTLFSHYAVRKCPIQKVEELRELFRVLDKDGEGGKFIQ